MTVGSVGLDDDFIGDAGMVMGGDAAPVGIDELVRRMAADEFDLVAVGRALLQDPQWLEKIRDGRSEELTPFNKMSLANYY